uniref:Nucleoporin Nup120/160 beta-propeller domain-containing protein n=1 Tax=Hyaloperonospora arabidopsidis (strain Emoy2) TaxID=559515 RepID=M4BZ10_HYAAE
MGPLLQEAHFACFDDVDDNISSGESSLPTFVISSPFACSQPPRSATAHALECRASGNFFFQNESLRDRFVCWRVVKNVLLLREWSLHTTLSQNGIRLEFPAPIVATGVFAGERWKDEQTEGDDTVTINVVTHAAAIHRFTYSMPSSQKLSIFSESDVNALPEPKPATSSRCDMLQSLNCNETLTAAFWVNEYTVVLGTDAGHVVGVNFGLSGDLNELREFVFSDRSMVSWLWQRLVQSAAIKLTGSSEESRAKQRIGAAVLAVTCFQIDEDDDDTDEDVCVVTISADGVLKAWSFSAQSCIGRQQLRTLVTMESDGCAGEIEERDWNDEDMISNDGDRSSSTGAYATHAKSTHQRFTCCEVMYSLLLCQMGGLVAMSLR